MDWHELSKIKVTQLREMAQEQGATGTSGMQKEELVEFLAEKLGIERPHKVVRGKEKAEIKGRIRELKELREAALAAGDKQKLQRTRRQIHRLKRRIRNMGRLTH